MLGSSWCFTVDCKFKLLLNSLTHPLTRAAIVDIYSCVVSWILVNSQVMP